MRTLLRSSASSHLSLISLHPQHIYIGNVGEKDINKLKELKAASNCTGSSSEINFRNSSSHIVIQDNWHIAESKLMGKNPKPKT